MSKKNLYRDIIIKNYTRPENLVSNPPYGYKKDTAYSNTCSELYHIFLKIKADKIIDAKFSGYGCSISKASLNIFCSMIKNKNIIYVNDLIANYKQMINHKKFNKKVLENLVIFKNILIYKNRKNCVLFTINKISEMI